MDEILTNSLSSSHSYKDLDIIDAVRKSTTNIKTQKMLKKQAAVTPKSEVIRQSKKILDTISAGSFCLATCLQTAQDNALLYPETFENELFQVFLDYLKRQLTNVEEANLTKTCVTLGKFIGNLYCADVFRSESIKGTLSLLTKYESIEQVKHIQNSIVSLIYEKAMESNDEILKSYIPTNFERITSEGEIDNEDLSVDSLGEDKENILSKRLKDDKKDSSTKNKVNQASVSVAIPLQISPTDRFKVKFKILLYKRLIILNSKNLIFFAGNFKQIITHKHFFHTS